jgi:hypothetical protein
MSTEHAPVRLGITGTDTEIGKTVVSCALAALARSQGLRRAVMKPIETGVFARTRVDGPSVRSDADRLRAAAGVQDPIELIRPIAMVEPLAPMVAARRATSLARRKWRSICSGVMPWRQVFWLPRCAQPVVCFSTQLNSSYITMAITPTTSRPLKARPICMEEPALMSR